MQRGALTHMINARQITDTASLLEIEQLKNQFPYCATFQLLYAIGLSQTDNIHQNEQINLASLYITERSKLYQYTTVKPKFPDLYPVNDHIPAQAIEVDVLINSTTNQSSIVTHHLRAIELHNNEKHVSPAKENESDQNVSSNKVLSEKPLEAEILRSAVVQLGEIAIEEFISTQIPTSDRTLGKVSIDIPDDGSFGDWLASVNRRSNGNVHMQSEEIIEKFIQETPQITPVKHNFFSPAQVGKQSLVEDESLVTETLAKIYERQGDFKRAARAYANLSLKFPEKSVYFAALQNKAEEKIKN